ncbi:MAG: PepSY domain-containing protein, partial [Blastomonas sp.]|nr:PepSY domain-containing protein [Blastomonas sp.]
VGERIVHTADPLHFGTFGGLVTKLIRVAFGIALVAMAGSGAVIYAKRLRIVAGSGVSMGMCDYLGAWKWPSILAITAVPAIAFWSW